MTSFLYEEMLMVFGTRFQNLGTFSTFFIDAIQSSHAKRKSRDHTKCQFERDRPPADRGRAALVRKKTSSKKLTQYNVGAVFLRRQMLS